MQLLIVFLAVLFTFVNALSHMKAAIAEMDEFTEKAIEEEDRSIESLLPYLNDHRDKIVSKFNLDKDTFIQHHRQLSFWREEKDCTQRVKPKYGNAKPDWMSTLDRNMNFTQLTLPGTHDSGAYALTTSMNTYDPVYIQLRVLIEKFKFPKHLLGRAMCKFSLTQSKTISEQLEDGIRYLDLRVDYDPETSTYRTFHALFGDEIEPILHEIQTFMQVHTSEILVLELSHFLNPNVDIHTKLQFQKLLLSKFGSMLYHKASFQTTIGEMQDSNQRIILIVDENDIQNHKLIYPGNAIHNTFANTPDLTIMQQYNDHQLLEFQNTKHPTKLFKLSWTLTADITWILTHLHTKHGLYLLALECNQALGDFLPYQANRSIQFGNILIIDYHDHSDLIPRII